MARRTVAWPHAVAVVLAAASGFGAAPAHGAPLPPFRQTAPPAPSSPSAPAPRPAPAPRSDALPQSAAELLPAPEASALFGRVVAAVEVEASAGEDARALASLIDVQPGHTLTASLVQGTVERIYALGRFAQVEARLLPAGEAVDLRLVVTPTVHLDELHLKGLRGMDADGLRRALRLQVGDEVDGQTEARLRARAQRHAASVGFPQARFTVQVVSGSAAASVAITVRVEEGSAERIAQVHVGGRRLLKEAYLLQALQLRPGHVLDVQALERHRHALETLYVEHGFLRAEVKLLPPVYRPAPRGAVRTADVFFTVEAHERVRFAFRGVRLFPSAELQALWPARIGGPPEAALGLFAQRIRALYARQSYPNAQVKVALGPVKGGRRARAGAALRPDFSRQVAVEVQEGAPVWVGGLRIEGAHMLPNALLRRQVGAVLGRELTEPSFFTPLRAGNWSDQSAPAFGVPWAPHRVPPERRWVPELYARAADDIAAAYRTLGFAEVTVAVPDYEVTSLPAGVPLRDALGQDDVERWRPAVRPGQLPPLPQVQAVARLVVTEGPQRFIERLTLRGNRALTSQVLLAAMAEATGRHALAAPVRPTAPLSEQGVEDARIAIVRRYREQGYVYVRVVGRIDQAAGGGAEVHFEVEEGPKVVIQHVLVRGNRHTREGIVRSRLTLKPHGVYRLDRAIADQQDLMALGVFQRARIKLVDEEHQSPAKDVVVEVDERARQPVEVVPGLSTAEGPRLRLSYAHINVLGSASTFVASLKLNRQLFFPLYGRYHEVMRERFAAYHGLQQLTRAVEREARLGLRSPPVRALPFDPVLRLDVVDQRVIAVQYGLDAATATLGVDTDPSPSVRVSVEVQGGLTQLECPLGDEACDDNLANVRRLRGGRPIQKGSLHAIKFSPMVRLDRRDDPIAPSRGFLLQARISQAFGSAKPEQTDVPFAFTKYEATATGYLPAFGAVWASSFRLGSIVLQRSTAPVDERFFLGGRDSLRGFVESTLIPEDACVLPNTQAALAPHCAEGLIADGGPPLSLGGNSFALWKNELRLPLGSNVSFDLFVDVGNLWVDLARAQGLHLRVGTGVGLRYATPVGAMTLDFGVNPARRQVNQEAGWQFHFSIGSF